MNVNWLNYLIGSANLARQKVEHGIRAFRSKPDFFG